MWEGWWAVPRKRDQMQATMSQMLLIATPEPSSEGCKNTLAGLWGTVVWVFGAPPQNPNNIFWHCAIQTPPSEESKKAFAGLWGTVVWVVGAPPQNPNNIFWHRVVQTPLASCTPSIPSIPSTPRILYP